MASIDGITHQNSAMVEQLSAAAQSLSDQVEAVRGSLSLFRLRPGEGTMPDARALKQARRAEQETA